ncbi:MAG: cobalt-precorrin 5A hydrolase [Chroococcales cyanobacterium]
MKLSGFEDDQPIAAIAVTPSGVKRLLSLCDATDAILWIPASCQGAIEGITHPRVQVYTGSLTDHLAQIWPDYRAFICCVATGAVLRAIAPLLQHKSIAPAVVVVDEAGKFTLSLCSGHPEGADSLTQAVAHHLGATPLLTGGSSTLQWPGIDVLGVPFGWTRGEGNWTAVSAAIARQEPVEVIQEVGCTLWQQTLPENHPFILESPDNPKPPKARVWISAIQRQFAPDSQFPKVQWHPRVLWVGVGCKRGTSRRVVETAIAQVCQSHHFAQGAIAGIATIDIKADEVGLLELCQARQWPLQTFPTEVLKSVTVPTPSRGVAHKIGTPSVAEAAAIVAAQGLNSPGETSNSLLVSKQIVRLEGEPGAVTVAIAQAEREYIEHEKK